MAFGAPSLKGRALRCLARREHSRAELERKLARHAEDRDDAPVAQQIAAALDELAGHGLIDDARVAASVLHSQAPRQGVHRLRRALQAKGLDAALVASTLQQVTPTEFDRACALWKRRFGAAAPSPEARARQQRFLAGRGFDGDVVRRVLREVGAPSPESWAAGRGADDENDPGP